MFMRIAAKGGAGSISLRRAFALFLVQIVGPLVAGVAVLVVAIWVGEHKNAEEQLKGSAGAVVHAVDMYVAHGRSQLETIAALGEIDRGELAPLYRLARDVLRDHPGTVISLVRPDGQLLINTSLPFGSPLPNLWRLEEQKKEVVLRGRGLPISSQGLAHEVFRTGEAVYSGLFMGVSASVPRMALAIPVHREGTVVLALMLAFPAEDLSSLLDTAGLPPQSRAVLVDRHNSVIAKNGNSPYRAADKFDFQGPMEVAHEMEEADGTTTLGVSVKTGAGYTLRVSMPSAVAHGTAHKAVIGWGIVAAGALILSIMGIAKFKRRLSDPLRLLAGSVIEGATAALPGQSNIHEIDLLAESLRAAERSNELRRQEQIARVAAEHKQEAIEAHEAQMKRVFAGLHVSVTVLDVEGRVIEMNHAPGQRADVSRSDVLGQPLWDCCWWNYDPEVQRTVRESVLEAREGREAVRYNLPAQLDDGRMVMVDFQLSPLADENGEVSRLIAGAVDVQDRVEAVRSLQARESEAREIARKLDKQRGLLDAALQATPAGILLCDGKGRIIRMNHATVLLWGGELPFESLGEATWKGRWAAGQEREGELVKHDEWPLSRALRSACPQSAVIEIEPFDRSARKTVQINAAPVIDEHGVVVAGVVVHMDITDQVRSEAALREADRHKNEFLATLGHELRNPLAPIRSAVHILGKYPASEPRLVRAHRIIERQTRHMTRLVDDLLDLARITQGTIKLQRCTLLLQEVVLSAVEAVAPVLEAKDVSLRERFAQDPLYVEGDATRLSQALVNLLSNACKFTASGGQVCVRVRGENGLAVVEVADDGVGLAPDAVERIFGLFVQEQPSGAAGNSGLGIGLALARDLLVLHGGTLRAESAGLGKGSSFTARLPLVDPPAAAPLPMIDTVEDHPVLPYRVLLVDDNVDACDLMRELLEMSGFEARSAYDGAKALAAAQNASHDAFVLDIGLPDMTGYELCRRIRRELGGAPVMVALTGWGQDQDKKAATIAGFDGHLTKPADPDQLTSLLLKLLKTRRKDIGATDPQAGIAVRAADVDLRFIAAPDEKRVKH